MQDINHSLLRIIITQAGYDPDETSRFGQTLADRVYNSILGRNQDGLIEEELFFIRNGFYASELDDDIPF